MTREEIERLIAARKLTKVEISDLFSLVDLRGNRPIMAIRIQPRPESRLPIALGQAIQVDVWASSVAAEFDDVVGSMLRQE
ncbi:MAG: hypothetical protein JWP89_263 [Schlesneria sp.]|nr:hypothetical protein [Schlesneria sp.]